MTRDEVRSALLEILRNHERERRVLEAQIIHEQKAFERDATEIAESGYPVMTLSDKVTSSKATADAATLHMVELIARRRDRSEALVYTLGKRLELIDAVQDLVLQMDARSRTTLVALYYPYRTYAQASAILGVNTTTLTRQRAIALERLVSRAIRSNLFK